MTGAYVYIHIVDSVPPMQTRSTPSTSVRMSNAINPEEEKQYIATATTPSTTAKQSQEMANTAGTMQDLYTDEVKSIAKKITRLREEENPNTQHIHLLNVLLAYEIIGLGRFRFMPGEIASTVEAARAVAASMDAASVEEAIDTTEKSELRPREEERR